MSIRGSLFLDQISAQDEVVLRRRQAERDYTTKPRLGPRALNDAEIEKLRAQLLRCLQQR